MTQNELIAKFPNAIRREGVIVEVLSSESSMRVQFESGDVQVFSIDVDIPAGNRKDVAVGQKVEWFFSDITSDDGQISNLSEIRFLLV